jgi:cell filamentation protein
MRSRYAASGTESEFEPGSRNRVLRNLQEITRVGQMQQAESDALESAQEQLLVRYHAHHSFDASDICIIHREWLGKLYRWAGSYRSVNVSKGGFVFAAAQQVPRLMQDFETRFLRHLSPCSGMNEVTLVGALARTHAELVIIHPFREGNGRSARLLAWLMALQAGMPPLDFWPLQGRGKRSYVSAIHAAYSGNYGPMEQKFRQVIRRTLRPYAIDPE